MYEAEGIGVELPRENPVHREEIIQQGEPIDVEATIIETPLSMDEI